jgi:LuxR family maltose regulon positive regulatory protein
MYTHNYDAALRESREAQKLLPKNRSAWDLMALWSQAETQKRVDHIGKAIDTLYEALRIGKAVGGKIFTYTIVNSLAADLYFNGRRSEALDVCQKIVARSEDADDPALAGIYGWIGRLYFEANQLEEARKAIEKSLKLSEKAGADLSRLFCYYYASQIYQACGDSRRALETVQTAQSLADNATLSDKSWLNAWEANLNLQQNDMLQVEHWARSEGPTLTQRPDYLNMETFLVYARYLVKTGEMNEAAKHLREMEKQASRRGYYRWLITINLLQSIVWESGGKKSQALDCIKKAIHIAAPEEYQRAFLDENPAILKLVPELSQESPAFIMRLLRSASSLDRDGKKIPASILPDPLSERETEILRLLLKGEKGPQISEELFISYSTVRTHIKSIHRKLDVHSRQELIEKARLLELV